jgi:hypothetical protein
MVTEGGASDLRPVWLAIAVLAAVMVALIAGGLSFIDDRRVAAAVIRGGVAFGAAIGCLLGVYAFLF